MNNPKSSTISNALSGASGASLGLSLGTVGFLQPLGAILLILIFLFRCRLGWAFFSFLLGSGLAMVFDPSSIGWVVLEFNPLEDLWTRFYNTPILAISGFNQTRVMGGLTLGLIAFFLLFPYLLVRAPKKNTPLVDEPEKGVSL